MVVKVAEGLSKIGSVRIFFITLLTFSDSYGVDITNVGSPLFLLFSGPLMFETVESRTPRFYKGYSKWNHFFFWTYNASWQHFLLP